MTKNDTHKSPLDTSRKKEDRIEQREQFKLQRRVKRAERIEKAKISLKEEIRADIIENAKHILIEEELAERIDQTTESLDEMRQELRELRKKHRAIIREIRKDLKVSHPIGAEEGAKRRQRSLFYQEYMTKTLELIREIEKKHRAPVDEELFEILPPDKAIMASSISYTELATRLNDIKHLTFYGNEWTRISIQKVIKQHGQNLQGIGHKQDVLLIANAKRTAAVNEFAIKMRDEVLPTINTDQPHMTIAKELNARGIKTRTDGEWGNVSVKRLLLKIEEL